MIPLFLSVMLFAAPACPIPESMPAPNAAMGGFGDPSWCLVGVDPFALAGPDMRPARQMVWQDRENGGASIVQWRRGGPDAMPATWRVVFARPSRTVQQVAFREILIQKLADTLIVITTNPAWRIGNAVCAGDGGASIAYLPEGAVLTDADRNAIRGMEHGDIASDPGAILCTTLFREGDSYRGQFRGPQGRPLPEIDEAYATTRVMVTAPGDFRLYLRPTR